MEQPNPYIPFNTLVFLVYPIIQEAITPPENKMQTKRRIFKFPEQLWETQQHFLVKTQTI